MQPSIVIIKGVTIMYTFCLFLSFALISTFRSFNSYLYLRNIRLDWLLMEVNSASSSAIEYQCVAELISEISFHTIKFRHRQLLVTLITMAMTSALMAVFRIKHHMMPL